MSAFIYEFLKGNCGKSLLDTLANEPLPVFAHYISFMWHVAQMFLQRGSILEAVGGGECCKQEETKNVFFSSFLFSFPLLKYKYKYITQDEQNSKKFKEMMKIEMHLNQLPLSFCSDMYTGSSGKFIIQRLSCFCFDHNVLTILLAIMIQSDAPYF